MDEVWKDIEGYEGLYQVSNLGRVKSLERRVEYFREGLKRSHCVPESIRVGSEKQEKGKTTGYLCLVLYKNNKGQNMYIHRLVADAFIQNPEGKETVNHKNGNKHDNRAENLEWNTYSENNMHAYTTGLNDSSHRRNCRGSIPVAQYDANMNLINVYPSIREAERQTGIDDAAIALGIRKGWKYGGFIWKKAQ